MCEKYYTVHVILQMLVVVKSVTAALKDTPNEFVWLLLAEALQLHGVQVSQVANTMLTGTHKFLERSFKLYEPPDVMPWLLLLDT